MIGSKRLDQLLWLCILSCMLTFNLYLMYAAITLQPKIVNDTHCNAGELDPIPVQHRSGTFEKTASIGYTCVHILNTDTLVLGLTILIIPAILRPVKDLVLVTRDNIASSLYSYLDPTLSIDPESVNTEHRAKSKGLHIQIRDGFPRPIPWIRRPTQQQARTIYCWFYFHFWHWHWYRYKTS